MEKIFYLLVLCAACVHSVIGSSSSDNHILHIIRQPSYVEFTPSKQPLPVSHTSDLVSSLLGLSLSTSHSLRWDGLAAGSNPFQRPEAVALVVLEGFQDGVRAAFDKAHKHLQYRLDKGVTQAVSLLGTYSELEALYENNEDRPHLVNMESDEDWSSVIAQDELRESVRDASGSSGSDSKYQWLDLSHEVDRKLLEQMLVFDAVMDQILAEKSEIRNGVGDVYKFDMTSLRDYITEYREDDTKLDKTFTYINHSLLDKLCKTLQTVYGEDFVLLVMTLEKQTRDGTTLYRSKRQVDVTTADTEDPSTWNLSSSYDPNYPVIFNIILWLSILLAVALYAVSVSMWHMDPGRESIIYRMTSTRMKKDS